MNFINQVIVKFCRLCFFSLIFLMPRLGLNAQDTPSAYSQPALQKFLQIQPSARSISYSFWVDQMDSYSMTVTSVRKDLFLQLTDPKGYLFVFGLPNTPSFQNSLSPDPILNPEAPGANYHFGFNAPSAGQWTLQITTPSAQTSVLTLPVQISFNNQVGSFLLGGSGTRPLGTTMVFSAAVLDGSAKVNNLQIRAFLYQVDDISVSPLTVAFADDGQGADYASGDGIYSARFTPTRPGQYVIQVELSGDATTGHFQRSIASGFKIVPRTARIVGTFKERVIQAIPR